MMARASAAPSCGSVPCAQFIKDDERATVNMLEDSNYVRDVTTECAQRLLDGLFITDIGVDIVETRQLRAALRRDVQSALAP
jgi:hypothetical protein